MKRRNRFQRRGELHAGLALLVALTAVLGCGSGDSSDGGESNAADSTSESTSKAEESSDEKSKQSSKSKKGGSKEDDEDPPDEAVPVDVAVLGYGPIEAVIRASANLEAERSVAVRSEAARRVTELLVEEGDRVGKGDLLLRLQDDQQRSAVARAQTEVAKAQREFDRQKRLHERDLTTDQILNDATDELEKRKLAVEDATRELGYTELRAPISGTITNRMVNLGDHVQLGEHVFDMVDFESIVARIFVPEKNLHQLRPDLLARIRATAIRDEPFAGRVKRISPVVDPRTGTVKVTVDVGGREQLLPGLYVDVELITDVHEEALLVPKRALVYDNDQIFVYRLQPDHTVARLRLVPRLADRDWVEPVGGLAVGDSIVIAGQAGLKHGARVRLPALESKDGQGDAASSDEDQANAQGSSDGEK